MNANYNELKKKLSELYPEFPKKLKLATEYVLENEHEIALCTIRDAAAKAQTTPSTLVRLAQLLGYKSYNEFRDVFKDTITVPLAKSFKQRASQFVELDDIPDDSYKSLIAHTTEKLLSQEVFDLIPKASKILLESKKIYLMGSRDAFTCAFHFYYLLQMALPKAELIRSQETMLVDNIKNISKNDCLIAFSTFPHTKDTFRAYTKAKEKGARIIAITDKKISKITPGAEIVFALGEESINFFPSQMPFIGLCEMILADIVKSGGKKILKNVSEFEKYIWNNDVWLN